MIILERRYKESPFVLEESLQEYHFSEKFPCISYLVSYLSNLGPPNYAIFSLVVFILWCWLMRVVVSLKIFLIVSISYLIFVKCLQCNFQAGWWWCYLWLCHKKSFTVSHNSVICCILFVEIFKKLFFCQNIDKKVSMFMIICFYVYDEA